MTFTLTLKRSEVSGHAGAIQCDLDGALRAFLPDTKHRQWRIRCGWTVTSDDGELLNVFLSQAKSARSARAPETGSDDASL
jgi:hypothetical protein